MSTKEIVVNMLDSLSDAQIESIKALIESFIAPQVKNWENIEEVEPDEWDKEMIADSKIDNDESISLNNLIEKLGVNPDDLRD